MMMMMGENAFYVNTTHLLVVLYVVVRKRLKEAIYNKIGVCFGARP
jgi:hypothetical protein